MSLPTQIPYCILVKVGYFPQNFKIILVSFLLKVGAIWLSIDIVTLATGWYAVTVVRPRWSARWRRVVANM